MPDKNGRIVCPGCGMSTWTERGCALPGCENHDVLVSDVTSIEIKDEDR